MLALVWDGHVGDVMLGVQHVVGVHLIVYLVVVGVVSPIFQNISWQQRTFFLWYWGCLGWHRFFSVDLGLATGLEGVVVQLVGLAMPFLALVLATVGSAWTSWWLALVQGLGWGWGWQ